MIHTSFGFIHQDEIPCSGIHVGTPTYVHVPSPPSPPPPGLNLYNLGGQVGVVNINSMCFIQKVCKTGSALAPPLPRKPGSLPLSHVHV